MTDLYEERVSHRMEKKNERESNKSTHETTLYELPHEATNASGGLVRSSQKRPREENEEENDDLEKLAEELMETSEELVKTKKGKPKTANIIRQVAYTLRKQAHGLRKKLSTELDRIKQEKGGKPTSIHKFEFRRTPDRSPKTPKLER